eukprot:4786502-Pleurochrysis_carterae.AAC.3
MHLLARVGAILICSFAVLRLGVGMAAWRAANKLERPSYKVLHRLPRGIEIREYEPYLIAETTVRQEAGKPESSGFRTVARYIFGGNKPRIKMAMTAPVRTSSAGEQMSMTAPVRSTSDTRRQATKVSFVLSSKYSRRTAPVPLDRAVCIKQIPCHVLAVRSFSGGPPSARRVAKERSNILAALEARGVRPLKNIPELVYGAFQSSPSLHCFCNGIEATCLLLNSVSLSRRLP